MLLKLLILIHAWASIDALPVMDYDYYWNYPQCCYWDCKVECYPSPEPSTPTPTDDICDAIPGWAQINGRNFYLSSEEENLRWDVAEARAIEHPGGRLFEVRSSADNAVFEAVKNCYRGRIWIGGNDLAQTGNWVWASNGYEIDGYENFDNSEAKTGDCLDVRLEANFAWLKSACDGSGISHAFIVETDQEHDTTPMTTAMTTITSTARPTFVPTTTRGGVPQPTYTK